MDFIRSIVNDSEFVTDAEAEKFLEDLKILDEPRYTALEWAMMEGGNDLTDAIDAIQIDEDAFDRIAKRVEKRDLINYRLIIGAENLMKARLFLELAKEGKNIPSVYVKGMQPAIEMLDDIVTAGPGFVQLLRVLHKRAQKKQ